MNAGYSTKELQDVLGLKCAGSVTDAVRPQLRKMCRLFLYDPRKFMEMAMPVMMEIQRELDSEELQRELCAREVMLEGGRGIEEIVPRPLLKCSGTRRTSDKSDQ